MRNVAAQATVRLTAKGDCLQMDKESLAQVKTLCFLKTMFSSVRELRSKGADVQVCRSITGTKMAHIGYIGIQTHEDAVCMVLILSLIHFCAGPAHRSCTARGLPEGWPALLGALCAAPGHQQAQRGAHGSLARL